MGKYFVLGDFYKSAKAVELGIVNSPNPAQQKNVETILAPNADKVRAFLGYPVTVTSGFRCPALNRAVGGDRNSEHVLGTTMDFICPGYGTPLEIAKALANSDIKYNQLIHEKAEWVHISFPQEGQEPKMELLTIDNNGTRPGLLPVRSSK